MGGWLWASAGLLPAQEVFLVPLGGDEAVHDGCFLAAVPAASQVAGQGKPLVVAVDPEAPWSPQLVAWLGRLQAPKLTWVGELAPGKLPMGWSLEATGGKTAQAVAIALAKRCWKGPAEVVLCRFEDRAAAAVAAALAGRLRVPLLPIVGDSPSLELRRAIKALGVERLLLVGEGLPNQVEGASVRRVKDALAAARELRRRRLPVKLLALMNPKRETGQYAREHGAAAALLAVGREGMVLPWEGGTQWKAPVALRVAAAGPRAGVRWGESVLREGELVHDGRRRSFVTGRDERGRGWMQLLAEGPRRSPQEERVLRTGDSFEADGRQVTISLDANEKKRGEELRLTSPTPAEVRAELLAMGKAAKGLPEAMVIVGWPQSFPMAILADGQGIDADLVSDMPYAQIDDDPFVDLAFTRLAAEDLSAASLIVARGFSLPHMPETAWASRFATAGWKVFAADALSAAGLQESGHFAGPPAFAAGSELTQVGLLVHRGHSNWLGMGKCYRWDSEVLLSPCVVESSGCSAMALDLDPQRRSVAARLLRNGALAYAGNMRRSTARQQLFRSEFRNALLRGESLGEAQRSALNRMIVAALDTGEMQRGLRFYQLACAAVFGDPMLTPPFPAPKNRKAWAAIQSEARRVNFRLPTAVRPVAYAPLEEWGCKHEQLTTWWGPMLGTDAVWSGAGRHDLEELWFTAEVRTKRKWTAVRELGESPEPLRWKGRAYVDHHADGSRSLLWRFRVLDAEMVSADVRAELREASFELLRR